MRLEAVTAIRNRLRRSTIADGDSIDATMRPGSTNSNGELTVATTIGDGDPDAVIRVWLGAGSVWVIVVNEEGTE